MSKDKRDSSSHERNARDYLDKTSRWYSLDFSTGLYKPHISGEARTENDPIQIHIRECPPLQTGGPRWTEIADTIVGAVALLISFATLIGLFFTAKYAYLQWGEARRTAEASLSAANTASASLELTRKEFEASQVAILHPTPGFQANGQEGYLQVNIGNLGHLPATKVHGDIVFTQTLLLKKVSKTQVFSRAVISNDYLTRTFLLGEPLNLVELKGRDVRVTVHLRYFNGIEDIQDQFCSALISGQYGGEQWEDCENKKAFQP